ncbi:TetR family transcriptional regulator [Actinoplanes sp. NPDC049596]|uniref:TetR/AcrR family transcriptional regulator n=1 Tax=unclassified Actinoplanes TaxID=2626549 RepID=UPI00342562EA
MARNPQETQRKILEAATGEFAARGLAGTRMEAIAARAGVNKERAYNYFGGKEQLFTAVLAEELERIAAAVPIDAIGVDGIGEFAARCFDYHLDHPVLVRLLHWEALELDGDIVDEVGRTEHYQRKVAAIADAQRAGEVTGDIPAAELLFLVLAMAAWWAAVPQVARMVAGAAASPDDRARRRDAVAAAARKVSAIS